MKTKVSKVTTGFSERIALDNKEFRSILEFDLFVMQSYADDYSCNYMGYDKTDVIVHFEDGETYSLRFDAEPGKTLVQHFVNVYNYYVEGEKPAWVNHKDWNQSRAEYQEFFNNYAL